MGLKTFWAKAARRHAEELGALAGRDRLMSPSSMSRALEAVTLEALRPVANTLLHTVVAVDEACDGAACGLESVDPQPPRAGQW